MVASGVSLRTAVAVGIVSYLLFSWVIPYLADRVPCSADGDEESIMISLEDYSMLLPNDYQMAELPFQRRVHPCRVFSDTYQEARTAFLEAAQELQEPFAKRNANPLSVHHLTVFTDDNDQQYTTDIVVLPGNQPGLVVHSSGVHGVEGYAGSAIQVAVLHLVRQFYEDGQQLWRHPTVVLVHAVNPVGMARYRRVNERNVDLNRNGLQPDEWSGPYVASNPNRGNYERFSASLFNPATPPTVWSATIGYVIRAAGAVLRYGLPQLKAAMVGGQYHDPTGIFYGGKERPEPSLTLLKEWLEQFLSNNNNNNGTLATGAVTWVDVHTGLGPFGVDTLLVSNNSIDGDMETSYAHLQQYFTAGAPSGSDTARTVAQGYEQVKGFINDYYQPVFAKQQPNAALIVTQEFGTWPAIWVGRALIWENAAHRHLPAAPAREWAQRTTKPAFYPQHSRRWRRAILERGVRVWVQAMRRSIQLSVEPQG